MRKETAKRHKSNLAWVGLVLPVSAILSFILYFKGRPYSYGLKEAVGLFLLLTLVIFVSIVYGGMMRARLCLKKKELFLAATVSVMTVAIGKCVVLSSIPSAAIPAAVAGMLIAILSNLHLAWLVVIIVAISIGILTGGNLGMMVLSLMGGLIGASAVFEVRKRSGILRAGAIVGLFNVLCIIGFGLILQSQGKSLLQEASWGLLNGALSGIIVLGILPLFEYIFKLTTNISLLELSDLGHPVLRELALKAPGTYHHSLVVGNLSESACEAIGANSLLARVGAYYHDIGKLEKPEYFSENQLDFKSKHDKLTPTMSALIITNHIRRGIELARKYKLNEAIINFIQEHHGSGLIFFFYQRALEGLEDEGEIKEEGFRYPGPKPQTKETAVVLLADSIEAASRAFAEPTPARIKGLVRKIINNKFINAQLDECDLTLRELELISDAFTRILLGIHHARVEYPHSA